MVYKNRIERDTNPNEDDFYPWTPIGGQGRSSDSGMATEGICFQNISSTPISGPSAVVHFNSQVDSQEVQEALLASASVSLGIGKFSAGVASKFSREIESTHLSFSISYFEQYYGNTTRYEIEGTGVDILTKHGQGVYKNQHDIFRVLCGNEIYKEMTEGISLYVALKVNFDSYADRESFEVNAKITYTNIVDVLGEIKQTASSKSLSGSIDILAYQQGGDPSKLPQIFEREKDQYYITDCMFNNINACKQAAQKVLDYSLDINNQVHEGYKLYPLLWNPGTGIEQYGLDPGKPIVNSTVEEARDELESLHELVVRQFNFVDRVINLPYAKSIEVTPSLKAEFANITKNKAMLENLDTGVPVCFRAPQNCLEVSNQIKNTLYESPVTMKYMNTSGYLVQATGMSGSGLTCDCDRDESLAAQASLVPINVSPVNTYIAVSMSGASISKHDLVSVTRVGDALSVNWNNCQSNATKAATPPNTYNIDLNFHPGHSGNNPCVNDYIRDYKCDEELSCPRGCEPNPHRYCSGDLNLMELDSPGC